MPELGNKHVCFSCEAKFYDLGRPEAICPKCGANQKDAKKAESSTPPAPVRRRRRDEAPRIEPDAGDSGGDSGDDESGSDDLGDEEIERPEGIDDDDVAGDDDSDDDEDDDD